MKALRLVADKTQRVAMTEEAALAEREKAVADMQAAKSLMTRAAQAGLDGDPSAERLTTEALAAQAGARKRLAEADATLEAIREAKAQAEREQRERVLEARWKKASDLCRQREQAADRAQRAAQELGRAWAEMLHLQQEIVGVVPLPAGSRASRIPTEWIDGARAAVEGQLFVASKGGLSLGASGFYTLQEFTARAIDIPSKVREQHRGVLLREGGKPITTRSSDGHEPTAA